uniref:Afadin n=1 Tax=Leptobrachium leishanense TaxID=445787 RepID=A0A8C5Q1Z2_9ANUR
MSGSREEERRKLADIINHWNANRLDLFEISQPTEVSEDPDREPAWINLPVHCLHLTCSEWV